MYSFKSLRSLAYSTSGGWYTKDARCISRDWERLNVDPSTVQATVQLFEETGEVLSIQGHHDKTTKKAEHS